MSPEKGTGGRTELSSPLPEEAGMTKGSLTDRQHRMLSFIQRFGEENGYPPSIREIGSAVGITSTSVVNYNLNRLVEEGYLDRDQNISRGLRLGAHPAARHGFAALWRRRGPGDHPWPGELERWPVCPASAGGLDDRRHGERRGHRRHEARARMAQRGYGGRVAEGQRGHDSQAHLPRGLEGEAPARQPNHGPDPDRRSGYSRGAGKGDARRPPTGLAIRDRTVERLLGSGLLLGSLGFGCLGHRDLPARHGADDVGATRRRRVARVPWGRDPPRDDRRREIGSRQDSSVDRRRPPTHDLLVLPPGIPDGLSPPADRARVAGKVVRLVNVEDGEGPEIGRRLKPLEFDKAEK